MVSPQKMMLRGTSIQLYEEVGASGSSAVCADNDRVNAANERRKAAKGSPVRIKGVKKDAFMFIIVYSSRVKLFRMVSGSVSEGSE